MRSATFFGVLKECLHTFPGSEQITPARHIVWRLPCVTVKTWLPSEHASCTPTEGCPNHSEVRYDIFSSCRMINLQIREENFLQIFHDYNFLYLRFQYGSGCLSFKEPVSFNRIFQRTTTKKIMNTTNAHAKCH